MTATISPLRRVALAYPVAVPWMALFMRGVGDYAKRHGGWTLLTSPPTLTGAEEAAMNIFSLRGWKGDGVIAAIGSEEEARAARRLKVPVVNLSGALQSPGLPRVMIDHYAVGRVAAEHLVERGFRHLAYYGIDGPLYSQHRAAGFRYVAEHAGIDYHELQSSRILEPRATWRQRVGPLERWLKRLPKPVGLLAVQDYRARVVVDVCASLGLRVPHDVAVIGVDDDPTVCEFCEPTLSSVSRNAWRNGYEAATMLDLLMSKRAPARPEVLVSPDGVIPRQSTDTVVVDEPHVAAAVHYMRDHLAEAINVTDVVRQADISRRQLEQRFRRMLNCTPHEYLSKLRVQRAKQLIEDQPRMKIRALATRCGFSSTERLRLVFRRWTGQTPQQYRAERRRGTSPTR